MALTGADVDRIARLARIRVPDGERESLARELSAILDWIEKLDELDVTDVEPMTGVGDPALPARPDAVTDGGDAARILANAPETADGHFVTPRVIE